MRVLVFTWIVLALGAQIEAIAIKTQTTGSSSGQQGAPDASSYSNGPLVSNAPPAAYCQQFPNDGACLQESSPWKVDLAKFPWQPIAIAVSSVLALTLAHPLYQRYKSRKKAQIQEPDVSVVSSAAEELHLDKAAGSSDIPRELPERSYGGGSYEVAPVRGWFDAVRTV